MGVAARDVEPGQFFFASSARRLEVASSMPGTLPSVARSMREIPHPCSPLSKCTLALVRISCGLWPAEERPLAKAIEKQPACAAPINSSGLVPAPSSIRLLNEYAPSKEPLASRIVPDPACSERSHLASAGRTGISGPPPSEMLPSWTDASALRRRLPPASRGCGGDRSASYRERWPARS